MTVVRSRRAGISAEEARQRPLYAKVLGLQYLRPSSLLCFVLFEGAIAVSALLALAELADWWVVAILPASVAAMVKLNDVIAGAVLKAASDRIPVVRGQASVPQPAQSAGPGARPGAASRGASTTASGNASGLVPGGAVGGGPGGAVGGGPGGVVGGGPGGAVGGGPGGAAGGVPGGGPGWRPGGASGFAWGTAPDADPSSESSPAPSSARAGASDDATAADEWIGSPGQRARQSATHRYE